MARRALAPTVAAVLFAFTGGAHGLGTQEITRADSLGPSHGPDLGSTIVQGTINVDEITVDFDTSRDSYVISDPDGVAAGQSCEAINATRVRCPRIANWFAVRLSESSDILRLVSPHVGSRAGSVVGGKGDDALLGSAGNNTLVGDHGHDRVLGRRGSDVLVGDQGRDLIVGGPDRDKLLGLDGSDRIDAIDGQRDGVIDCGRGRDKVAIDRPADPTPIDCEEIRYEPLRFEGPARR